MPSNFFFLTAGVLCQSDHMVLQAGFVLLAARDVVYTAGALPSEPLPQCKPHANVNN